MQPAMQCSVVNDDDDDDDQHDSNGWLLVIAIVVIGLPRWSLWGFLKRDPICTTCWSLRFEQWCA